MGHHAATDINANRSRDDSAFGRNNRSNGRAHSPMAIRHDGDVLMDERHRRHIIKLSARLLLDLYAVDPSLDESAARSVDYLHHMSPLVHPLQTYIVASKCVRKI